MIKGLVSGIVGIIVFIGLIVVINAVLQQPDASSQADISQTSGIESGEGAHDADGKQPLAENDPYFSAHDVELSSASQPPQLKPAQEIPTPAQEQQADNNVTDTTTTDDNRSVLSQDTKDLEESDPRNAPDHSSVGTHSAPPPKPVPYSQPKDIKDINASSAQASQRDMPQCTDTADLTYRDQLQPSHINVLIDAEQQSSVAAQQVLQVARKMTLSERTMINGSSWDYVNAVYERAGVSAKQRRTVHAAKYDGGPYADSRLLKPADWLYFVNASHHNSEHSALFIGWTDLHRKQALMLTYDNINAQPAQYRVFDLSRVYGIVRP